MNPCANPCAGCRKLARWGRSSRCFQCLSAARLILENGEPIAPLDDGRGRGRILYAARYRYRQVRCGKPGCHCGDAGGKPHGWYVYRQWWEGSRPREKYLGKAQAHADAFELPDVEATATRRAINKRQLALVDAWDDDLDALDDDMTGTGVRPKRRRTR